MNLLNLNWNCFSFVYVLVFVSFLNLFPQLSRLFFPHSLHFFVSWLASFMHLSLLPSLQFGIFLPYSSHHATFTATHPLSLLLHFHHSSLGELIASFFVLAEQQGNNGRVGLVVVATGMGGAGREGGRQRRKGARASTEGMLVVSWAAGKRAAANYTWVYAHRN